ncbi:MAG: tyrosine-type recombinase/integrase [Candidatus Tectomicrobia bacterium]|nr:tyrosine-type recombinase/integrase [Candidatus Tectomicrobia bacterium]
MLHEAINQAVQKAGIVKKVSYHAFRHSFATHLLMDSCDILSVQELLRHKNVSTTMIHTHILRGQGVQRVKSPLNSRMEIGLNSSIQLT